MNVTDSVATVTQVCNQLGLRISAIETLVSGGTRVVCASSNDAATLKRKLQSKVIAGPVKRSPLALAKRT